MNVSRRDAIRRMAILMGASAVGPRLLAGSFGFQTALEFSDSDVALLDEIGETIIPTSESPGAKEVNIGAFIAMMVADCYTVAVQKAFRESLQALPLEYQQRHGEGFLKGKAENRRQFLNSLGDKRLGAATTDPRVEGGIKDVAKGGEPRQFLRIVRELTILGYFSSEIGSTRAVRYLEVPGRYDGNVPYRKGDEWFI